MRALVKSEPGPGHVELRQDWPVPSARAGWVVVEVVACGICGTDLHIWHDEFKTWPAGCTLAIRQSVGAGMVQRSK
jgi:L-iditol 2-dehydrogenase